MPSRTITALAAAALVFGLLACGSDSHRPTAASGGNASSSATITGPTISSAAPPNDATLAKLLLTPAELGVTYANATLGGPMDSTQPCGQPDPRTVVRPDGRAVVLLADYLDGAGVAENLSRFANEQDADQVMTLLRAGVTCQQASIDNAGSTTPVTLSSVQDITAQVGADDAFAVIVQLGDGSTVTSIAGRVGPTVVVFEIGAKNGGLDSLQISKQGFDKVRAG